MKIYEDLAEFATATGSELGCTGWLKLRGKATVGEVAAVPGGVQATLAVTIELDLSAKPACATESVTRHLA